MLFGLGAGVAGYRAWPAYENNILRIRLPPFYLDTAALPNCIDNTRSSALFGLGVGSAFSDLPMRIMYYVYA
jgi:hypothetical protein